MSRNVRLALGAFALVVAGFVLAGIASGRTGVGFQTTTGTTTTLPKPPPKVAMCHRTHSKKHPFVTIHVSRHAVPAHLRHGDTLGACPPPAKQKKHHQKHEDSHGGSHGHTGHGHHGH